MNIMEKAQKRAILTIDKEYVFNDIYFGEEDITEGGGDQGGGNQGGGTTGGELEG